jgi:hypothetical protein
MSKPSAFECAARLETSDYRIPFQRQASAVSVVFFLHLEKL